MNHSEHIQAKICAARRFPFWDHTPSTGSVVTSGTWYLGPMGSLGLPFLRGKAGKLALVDMTAADAQALIDALRMCYGITETEEGG